MSADFQLLAVNTVDISVARRDPSEGFDTDQQGFQLEVNFSVEEDQIIANYKLELIVPSITGETITQVRFARAAGGDLDRDHLLTFLSGSGLVTVYPYLRTTARTLATMLGTSVRMPEVLPEGGLEPGLSEEEVRK